MTCVCPETWNSSKNKSPLRRHDESLRVAKKKSVLHVKAKLKETVLEGKFVFLYGVSDFVLVGSTEEHLKCVKPVTAVTIYT